MRYENLLSPLRAGNVILKSRLCHSKATPHFLQGPEEYFSENLISFYAGVAKNGAAYVTVNGLREGPIDRTNKPQADMARAVELSVENVANENYFSMCADAIHFYGSLANVIIAPEFERGYGISAVSAEEMSSRPGPPGRPGEKELSVQQLRAGIEKAARQAKYYKSLGFDMVDLYAPYRVGVWASSLSPATNKRTDEYGGCVENRCRLLIETARAIKAACGQDFLIEVHLSGEETDGGYTAEDTAEFARLAEGTIDIFQLRGYDGDVAHCTGFNSAAHSPMSLHACEVVKKSGAKIIVAGNGGYQDLDDIERWIAEGKLDMASMARAFICDFDYYQKALQGRGEDVVPCLRCNKCHVPSLNGPWYSLCSVNPKLGLAHRLNRMIEPKTPPQNVAVIGGGPAGMRAALFAKERGHRVTLFERSGALGGQLFHADFPQFKWPLKNYRDWLITQLYKQGVDVRLDTEPTAEDIKTAGFDAVIAATGAIHVLPDIPGAGEHAITPIEVYGNEEKLGRRVVVIGGSETGTETGMYLAECGHNVTVLTRRGALATDATPIHYLSVVRARWEANPNFFSILNVKTTAIGERCVSYTDAGGKTHAIECDSVVACGGVKPRQEEALKYARLAPKFYVIGDAKKPGNIHLCSRSAFAAANMI